MKKLNERIEATVKQSGQKSAPLMDKLVEMNETLALVERLMKEKQNYLLDQLKEVSGPLSSHIWCWFSFREAFMHVSTVETSVDK